MSILQIPTLLPAQTGIFPQTQKMVVSDSLAQLTTPGYLNSGNLQGSPVSANDIFQIIYNANPNTLVGTYVECSVSITNGVITLVPTVSPGNVVLPVSAGDLAVFANTSGAIHDTSFPVANVQNKTNILAGVGSLNISGTGPFDFTLAGVTSNSVAVLTTFGSDAGGDVHVTYVGCAPGTVTFGLSVSPGGLYNFNYVVFLSPQ